MSFTPTLESSMLSSRFASLEGYIEIIIEEQENQNTVKKTKRDVALLSSFKQKEKHEVKQLKFLSFAQEKDKITNRLASNYSSEF